MTSRGGTLRRNDTIETSVEREEEEGKEDGRGGIASACQKLLFFIWNESTSLSPSLWIRKVRMHVAERGERYRSLLLPTLAKSVPRLKPRPTSRTQRVLRFTDNLFHCHGSFHEHRVGLRDKFFFLLPSFLFFLFSFFPFFFLDRV